MKPDTQESYERRILKVLIFIQKHLNEPLDLDKLANLAHFSPFHFHRIFRGMVGESVAEYVRRLRMERAAALLRFTEISVTQLAFDSGYESMQSFIRAFRSRFGVSPTCYREQSRPIILKRINKQQPQITSLGKGKCIMKVEIKHLPARKVAYVRNLGPYMDCGTAWEQLCAWAGPEGLLTPDNKPLGLSWDDPDITPPEKIRYDACVPLTTNIETAPGINIQEVSEADYAVALHKGPFEKLIDSYAQICGQWLPQSGREPAQLPSVEIYLNDPQEVAPDDILVEIQIPLK